MKVYSFWNNKGGTGKTSLCFQVLLKYALTRPNEKILVLDLCPQANLSEFLLGGMIGNGAINLDRLYRSSIRKTVGGYFDLRLSNPFKAPSNLNPHAYLCKPYTYNKNIPANVDLMAGDNQVELQSSFISTLSTMNNPTVNSFVAVISWLKDFLDTVKENYDVVFIDMNPSFAIYTQIALAATDYLLIPVMADDSSKRALKNVFALVYGINLPPAYNPYTFNTLMNKNGKPLPKIRMIIKNRLTQYMGPASAYSAVLGSIDKLTNSLKASNPQNFASKFNICEIRDFQTSGVVAFAEAKSFQTLAQERLIHRIDGKDIQLNKAYINNDDADIANIANNLI